MDPLEIPVIIGSTRPGRRGPVVAEWFVEHARVDGGPRLEIVDLADHDVPAVLGQEGARLDGLTDVLHRADGYVVVTPEYNHSFPASLKQAIDWHMPEWAAKPVGLVSYGGRAGGIRAAEALRLVFAELHAVTMRDMVSLHGPWWEEDDAGALHDPTALGSVRNMMEQLEWWGSTLRDARRERSYVTA